MNIGGKIRRYSVHAIFQLDTSVVLKHSFFRSILCFGVGTLCSPTRLSWSFTYRMDVGGGYPQPDLLQRRSCVQQDDLHYDFIEGFLFMMCVHIVSFSQPPLIKRRTVCTHTKRCGTSWFSTQVQFTAMWYDEIRPRISMYSKQHSAKVCARIPV